MANFSISVFLMILLGVSNLNFGSAENPEEMGGYMEGDIVSIAPSLLSGRSRAGILGDKYRWPDATIPYEFSTGYPSSLQYQFRRAISHISSRTCIKFVPRTDEKDYISIIEGRGCYSHVGRIGGRQDVSSSSACNLLGIFVHELMHAIGFNHEQSRTDRDDYVQIKYENIKPGTRLNFKKFGANVISPFGVSYDYGSVMHYSRTAFTKNGEDTIVPKTRAEIGQRRGMSTLDATKINNMYCKNNKKEGDSSSQRRHLQLF